MMFMSTKATVLALFESAARAVVVAMLCSTSHASAQTVAPLKLTIPQEHPRIGITAADLDRVRGTINNEPWAGLWKEILAKSEWVQREQLAPNRAFGGVGGQEVRFTMTEGLECVAIHALVGKDKAAAKALSDFFESWDPAPLEKDIAEADFMSSGEFFEGLAVVLDWTWDLLSDSARAKLRAIVERRARHNYDGFVGKRSWEATTEANNHSMASMGALGLAAVALWNETSDAPLWAGLAHAKMKAYLASSFDPDGACYEGTMYGPFGLFRILPFSDCCARFGAGDAMANGFLDRVINQLINELTPGRDRMLPINDTNGDYLPWGGTLFLYGASHYRNPLARWAWIDLENRHAGHGGHTWAFALLWEDGLADRKSPDKLVAVTKGRGTLTVRTGWEKSDFLAAFECGRRVPGTHGQSDVGHFLIYAKGRCLAADTGYSNEAVEGSPQQSVGHNLVLVDGRGEVLTGNGQVTEGKLVQRHSMAGAHRPHAAQVDGKGSRREARDQGRRTPRHRDPGRGEGRTHAHGRAGRWHRGVAGHPNRGWKDSRGGPEGEIEMALFLWPTQESCRRTDPWPDIALAHSRCVASALPASQQCHEPAESAIGIVLRGGAATQKAPESPGRAGARTPAREPSSLPS
jgi:hypothetical protein